MLAQMVIKVARWKKKHKIIQNVLQLKSFYSLSDKFHLYKKLRYFKVSLFSKCVILSTAFHSLPSKFLCLQLFRVLPIVSSAFNVGTDVCSQKPGEVLFHGRGKSIYSLKCPLSQRCWTCEYSNTPPPQRLLEARVRLSQQCIADVLKPIWRIMYPVAAIFGRNPNTQVL